MGVNDDLADDAVMRSIRAMRAGNAIWKDLLPILKRAERDLIEKIEEIGGTRSFQSSRAERMLREVRRIIDGGAERFYDSLEKSGISLAEIEAAATVGSLARNVPIDIDWTRPAPALLKAVAVERPFEGAILKDHISKWSADTIFRMQGEVRTALVQGETIEQMQRRLRGVAEISRDNARSIASTYTAHVTNAARADTYAANSDVIEAEMWTAVLDDRTCLRCAPLDNKVFPIGKGPRPPLHFRCLPGDSLVTPCGDITLASKRWFEGDLVVIRTAAGRELSITPNHLIATRRGWVAAKSINAGDQVVCNGGGERARSCYDLRDYREARIEDVAESFFGSSGVVTAEVPVSAPDFHGDGAESEVAIIGTNSRLRVKIEPSTGGHSKKLLLDPRHSGRAPLKRLGVAASFVKRLLSPARRRIGGFYERLSFGWRRAIHAGLLLFFGVPQRDIVLAQNEFYLGAYQAEPLCNACRADAGRVKFEDFRKSIAGMTKAFNLRKRAGADRDALFFEDTEDGLVADPELFTDRLNRQSGLVEFDNVIDVSVKKDVACHVYNLETTKNIYLAQNIIVHNCRCVRVPITKNRDKLIKAGLLPEGSRASIDGQVPASMRYEDWLRRQPEGRQKDVLGPKRFAVWKKGAKLDKFVNDENEIIPLRDL